MQDAYKEIAPRLRGLRDALDLSAAELAEKVGVSEEMVRKYESGTEEIPVSYLMNVGQACGVDLPVLISGQEAHLTEFSLVRKGQGLSVDRRKTYDYRNLAYQFHGSRMEPFLVTVPPKTEDELSWSEHPGQEFIYLLEGELEIRLSDKVLVLNPGDSLYFASRARHALRGLNGKQAVFLDVII